MRQFASTSEERRQVSPPPTPGTAVGVVKLNQAARWNATLQGLRSYIIQSDEHGLPRYGVLSVLARRVPFHLYDHPALVGLCDTAFTDGVHVFVNTSFLAAVIEEDNPRDAPFRRSDSMLLILLHELSHILYHHHGRMPPNAQPLLWAIACDIAINVRLIHAYPELIPGPVFDDAWGTRPGDAERYLGQSEEHILLGLWESPAEPDKAFIEALKSALRSEEARVPEALDERGRRQGVHHHLVAPKDLANQLRRQGLDHVRRELQLPHPDDDDGFQRLERLASLRLAGDVDRVRELRDAHPKGSAASGAHLDESFSEWITNERHGRLEWKSLLRDLLLGNGMRFEPCDELPHDIYYVDPQEFGLGTPLYTGTLLPAEAAGVVVCIIDTSASVATSLLEAFVGEIHSLINDEGVSPDRLYLANADTTIRDGVQPFSEHPLAADPERLRLEGRGGTDITRVLNEVIAWSLDQSEFASHEFRAIIYFTDLIDRPPTRAALPEELPELLFLAAPSSGVQEFRRRVEDFATVAEIRDGTVIDLCPN